MVLATFVGKAARIYVLFTSEDMSVIREQTNWNVQYNILFMMLPTVLVMIAWSIVAPTELEMDVVDPLRPALNLWSCHNSSTGKVFMYSLYVYISFLFFTTLVQSYLMRHVPPEFNESKKIAVACYSILVVALLLVAVVFLKGQIQTESAYLIRSVGLLLGVQMPIVIYFVPILLHLDDAVLPKLSAIVGMRDLSVEGQIPEYRGSVAAPVEGAIRTPERPRSGTEGTNAGSIIDNSPSSPDTPGGSRKSLLFNKGKGRSSMQVQSSSSPNRSKSVIVTSTPPTVGREAEAGSSSMNSPAALSAAAAFLSTPSPPLSAERPQSNQKKAAVKSPATRRLFTPADGSMNVNQTGSLTGTPPIPSTIAAPAPLGTKASLNLSRDEIEMKEFTGVTSFQKVRAKFSGEQFSIDCDADYISNPLAETTGNVDDYAYGPVIVDVAPAPLVVPVIKQQQRKQQQLQQQTQQQQQQQQQQLSMTPPQQLTPLSLHFDIAHVTTADEEIKERKEVWTPTNAFIEEAALPQSSDSIDGPSLPSSGSFNIN